MAITIPKLNEMAYEQVELASVPFLTFVANKNPKGEAANYSFVLRGYVRHWLGNVWAEYDRVKLLDIFDASDQRSARSAAAAGGAPTGRKAAEIAGARYPQAALACGQAAASGNITRAVRQFVIT